MPTNDAGAALLQQQLGFDPSNPPPPPATPSAQLPAEGYYSGALHLNVPSGSIRVPTGRAALDAMAGAVAQQESGNRQTNEKGQIITSPKGARGVMQLMPSSFPGENIDDEGTNRALGKRTLGRLFDEYGNWDDALAAYNAGEGKVNAWIAAGRPDKGKGALPEETKNYVPAVLRKVGLSDQSPTATVGAKRKLDLDEVMDNMLAQKAGGTTEDQRRLADLQSLEGIGIPAIDDPMAALAHSVNWGALEFPIGLIQAGAEKVAPEFAQKLTEFTNRLENQGEGAEASKRHPVVSAIGRAVGMGVAMAGTGGAAGAGLALRAPKVAQALSALGGRLGWFGRGALAGGAAGATSFNPTPEQGQRIVEGVLGALSGGIIGSAGGALYRGVREIASRDTFQAFSKLIAENAHNVETQAADIKNRFVAKFDQVNREKNEKYVLRNAAGEELAPGFDRKAMGDPIAEAAESSRLNGVAIAPQTSTVARQVDRELGGPEARAQEAEHEAKIAQYEKDLEKWKKDVDSKVGGGKKGGAATDVERQSLINRLSQSGALPTPPVHPGEFEPPAVTPEQFGAARQAVQGARARAKDPKVRRQLNDMRQHLEQSARTSAEEAGLDLNTYLGRAKQADEFNREVYVPLRAQFGDNPRAVDPSRFYDKVVGIVEAKNFNPDEAKRFMGMIGPDGKQAVLRVMAKRAFDEMEKVGRTGVRKGGGAEAELRARATKVTEYIHDHARQIEAIAGKDTLDTLTGMAKLSQQLSIEPKRFSGLAHILTRHGILQAFGAVEVLYGLFEREPSKIGRGSVMIAAPWAGQALYRLLAKSANLPGVLPVIRRAAATAPDTAAMDRVLAEFERRVRRNAVVAAGVTGRTVAPAAAPLAPLGQAAAEGTRSLLP